MSDLVEELRPHRLTNDDAPVVYRARHIRSLCDRIERLEAHLAALGFSLTEPDHPSRNLRNLAPNGEPA
jgi:hypothetical protein